MSLLTPEKIWFNGEVTDWEKATILDGSKVGDSEAPPKGIPAVMVSGTWVVEEGRVTHAHPGKVLRHLPKIP